MEGRSINCEKPASHDNVRTCDPDNELEPRSSRGRPCLVQILYALKITACPGSPGDPGDPGGPAFTQALIGDHFVIG